MNTIMIWMVCNVKISRLHTMMKKEARFDFRFGFDIGTIPLPLDEGIMYTNICWQFNCNAIVSFPNSFFFLFKLQARLPSGRLQLLQKNMIVVNECVCEWLKWKVSSPNYLLQLKTFVIFSTHPSQMHSKPIFNPTCVFGEYTSLIQLCKFCSRL